MSASGKIGGRAGIILDLPEVDGEFIPGILKPAPDFPFPYILMTAKFADLKRTYK